MKVLQTNSNNTKKSVRGDTLAQNTNNNMWCKPFQYICNLIWNYWIFKYLNNNHNKLWHKKMFAYITLSSYHWFRMDYNGGFSILRVYKYVPFSTII